MDLESLLTKGGVPVWQEASSEEHRWHDGQGNAEATQVKCVKRVHDCSWFSFLIQWKERRELYVVDRLVVAFPIEEDIRTTTTTMLMYSTHVHDGAYSNGYQ